MRCVYYSCIVISFIEPIFWGYNHNIHSWNQRNSIVHTNGQFYYSTDLKNYYLCDIRNLNLVKRLNLVKNLFYRAILMQIIQFLDLALTLVRKFVYRFCDVLVPKSRSYPFGMAIAMIQIQRLRNNTLIGTVLIHSLLSTSTMAWDYQTISSRSHSKMLSKFMLDHSICKANWQTFRTVFPKYGTWNWRISLCTVTLKQPSILHFHT